MAGQGYQLESYRTRTPMYCMLPFVHWLMCIQALYTKELAELPATKHSKCVYSLLSYIQVDRCIRMPYSGMHGLVSNGVCCCHIELNNAHVYMYVDMIAAGYILACYKLMREYKLIMHK